VRKKVKSYYIRLVSEYREKLIGKEMERTWEQILKDRGDVPMPGC